METKGEPMTMQIQWHPDFESALKDAQRQHQHVLLDFFNPL
jgi:mRNA-degrading endonuclease RelE of RelBE toxin-antitoxin system